jgi:hypothetical protein
MFTSNLKNLRVEKPTKQKTVIHTCKKTLSGKNRDKAVNLKTKRVKNKFIGTTSMPWVSDTLLIKRVSIHIK